MPVHQEYAATDRLLTMREALGFLGISRSNAYRLLANNQIPQPIKLGTRNYFSARELEEWLKDRLSQRAAEVENVG